MAEGAILVQVGRRGALTLPKKLREKYNIRSGDVLTLLDLGGTFVLIPKVSVVDKLTGEIARKLREQGVTLEEMLRSLQEEREKCYEKHYTTKA